MKLVTNSSRRCLALLFVACSSQGVDCDGTPERRYQHSLLRKEREQKNKDEFPRVYTALVPIPSANDEENSANFVAELDIVEISECGLQLDRGGGGQDASTEDSFCRIAFLVHSEEELRELLAYAHPLNHKSSKQRLDLEFDRQRTDRLHYIEDANNQTTRAAGNTAEDNFSTIHGYSCYPDLAGTKQLMDDLVQKAQDIPNLNVNLVDIGDSYLKTENQEQGSDIWALELTGSGRGAQNNDDDDKAVFMVVAGIHPREYAPPALLAFWAQHLVDSYGKDAEITSILDQTKISLILQSNPDARILAETTETYRRKNLNNNLSSTSDTFYCSASSQGVDLNRNFPFRWGLETGSSSNPCHETYRGPSPASEPETQAIINYAELKFPETQRKSNPEQDMNQSYDEESTMGVFVDLHSYGEVLIWPWGHADKTSGNQDSFESMVRKIRHFNGYEFAGPGIGYMYPASGATDDWAYGALGAAGMTWELGTEFHQGCFYFKNYVMEDNLPALTYLAKLAKAPYSLSKGPDIFDVSVRSTSISASMLSSSRRQQQTTVALQVTVSDSAYSSGPSAQQGISEVRVFLDVHPYDRLPDGNPPPYLQLELVGDNGNNNSNTLARLTIGLQDWVLSQTDWSTLPLAHDGLHAVYFQAKDSLGYFGPVTAAWLEDEGPDQVPEEPVGDCLDSVEDQFSFINRVGGEEEWRSCQWLAINIVRWEWLCDRVEVAFTCLLTCNACSIFSS